MSETTTPAQTSDDLWNKARDAGLFSATQGTNAFDLAIDRFAAAVRASVPRAKDGGPAFPHPEIHDSFPRESGAQNHCLAERGLSARDYFAIHVSDAELEPLMPKVVGDMRDELILRGIIPPESKKWDVLNSYTRADVRKLRVALRYEFADQMLAARGAA